MFTDIVSVVVSLGKLAYEGYKLAKDLKNLAAECQKLEALCKVFEHAVQALLSIAELVNQQLETLEPSDGPDAQIDRNTHTKWSQQLGDLRHSLQTDTNSLREIVTQFTKLMESPADAKHVAAVLLLNEQSSIDQIRAMVISIEQLNNHLIPYQPLVGELQRFSASLNVPISLQIPRLIWHQNFGTAISVNFSDFERVFFPTRPFIGRTKLIALAANVADRITVQDVDMSAFFVPSLHLSLCFGRIKAVQAIRSHFERCS